MKYARKFEDLEIWRSSRILTGQIYQHFSKHPDFGFRDQVTRAAISVMNNIAEGFERDTPKDFSRFLNIAEASAGEVRSMIYLAEDLDYLAPEAAEQLRSDYAKVGNQIRKFRKSL